MWPSPDYPAPEQHVGRQRRDPVAHLVASRSARRPARSASSTSGSHQRWKVSTTTPDLLDGCCSARSSACAERRDDAPVGGEDRVHRLDAEPHAALARVRDQPRDRRPRRGRGPPARSRSPPAARRHQHEHGCPERGGLVDGARLSSRRRLVGPVVGGGEEAAAAQRRHPQPGVGVPARPPSRARPRRPARATGRPPGSPAADAAVDRLGHRPLAVVRWLRESRASRGHRGRGLTRAGRSARHVDTPPSSPPRDLEQSASGAAASSGSGSSRPVGQREHLARGARRCAPTAGRRPW